jgi:hypothetical protein
MAVDWLESKVGAALALELAIPPATFGHRAKQGESIVVVTAHIDDEQAAESGWIPTAEAAAILGRTPGHVRNLALKGAVRSRKDGRDLKVFLRDIIDRRDSDIRPGPKSKHELLAA